MLIKLPVIDSFCPRDCLFRDNVWQLASLDSSYAAGLSESKHPVVEILHTKGVHRISFGPPHLAMVASQAACSFLVTLFVAEVLNTRQEMPLFVHPLSLCREAVTPFSGWLNCTGLLATPSSDVWLLEVAEIAMATPRATVSTNRLNYVRVTSSGSGLVIGKGRWGS